jgi:hypothetical protein
MASEAPPASWLSRVFGGKDKDGEPSAPSTPGGANGPTAKGPAPPGAPAADTTAQSEDENKKGVFKRIFGIFGGSKKDGDKGNPGTKDTQP